MITPNETVAQVQAKTAALIAQMEVLARAFEADTGCLIHSVPVNHQTAGQKLAVVQVKVQIPGM